MCFLFFLHLQFSDVLAYLAVFFCLMAEGCVIVIDYAVTVFWNFWQVVFNLIMFRPIMGEIITAKLHSSDADGLRCMYSIFSWFLDCNYLLIVDILNLAPYKIESGFLHNQLI